MTYNDTVYTLLNIIDQEYKQYVSRRNVVFHICWWRNI